MKYPVQIEGFEGQQVELEAPRFLSAPALYVNGLAVPKNKGQFVLKRNDGQEVLVKLKPSLFYDAPSLEAQGKRITVIEPLPWYQYLLSSGPLMLVIGGIIGVLIGIGLIYANVRIFRSTLPPVVQYGLVLLLSFGVPVAYIAFSFLVATAAQLR